jgi:riboflavin kinase/FMN adenylyltransferase
VAAVIVARSPEELAGTLDERMSVTVGNFDGFHLGHQAVLAELVASSELRGGVSLAVTFDPHPLSVVAPERVPELLTPLDEKLPLLESSGVNGVLVVDFTREIAEEEAATFLTWVGIRRGTHLVLGYDFQMGRGRSCGLAGLSEIGAELGYGLDVVAPVEYDGLPISSSRIRAMVAEGDVESAGAMLGRPYTLSGEVVEGRGAGKEMGSPTANLDVPQGKLLPADGVYFVTVAGAAAGPGLLYVGERPTFGGGSRGAEVYVLDFAGDLYGARIEASVLRRMRGDVRFESPEALRRQIEEDVERARRLAAGAGDASRP